MNRFGLIFHHIGLALKRDEDALVFLEGLYYTPGEKIYDPEQNVYLRLCTNDAAPTIELILPGEGDGPLTPILNKHDQLFYHSCYETNNLKKSLKALEEAGLRIIPVSPPKPAILFGGRKVSFYTVTGFGLIEILEP